MKSIFCFCTLLAFAHGVQAQQGETRKPAPPVLPDGGTATDAVPPPPANTPDPGRSNTPSTATDRIIAEAPATVVVKPSNPFSGFRKVDKNGDGTISLSELINAFHEADQNGDERLNLEEFQRDIVDQPLDEGGAPDEPRIIIQEADPKPAPQPNRPESGTTNANKSNTGKTSTTKRGDSKTDDNENAERDVDVDINRPNNLNPNNPRRTGGPKKDTDSQSDEGNDTTPQEDEDTTPQEDEDTTPSDGGTGTSDDATDGGSPSQPKKSGNNEAGTKKPGAAQGGSGRK